MSQQSLSEVDPEFLTLVARRWAEGYQPIMIVFANEAREVITTVLPGTDVRALLEFLSTCPTESIHEPPDH